MPERSPTELAAEVDRWLSGQAIELTMGGEPTFVPTVPEGAEWATAAMGEQKLGYARRMASQLVESVYPGALVMQVFGKWYPGEPLPRWNILTMHPRSGEPLWPDRDRLLLDDCAGSNATEAGYALVDKLARKLRVKRFLLEAVEQDEARSHAGWVLPLEHVDGKWRSADWPFTKRRPISLFIGDSPVGLRLPLGDLEDGCLKSALTVEVRNGALEVFFPPLEWAPFQELVQLLRAQLEELDLRDVLLCGYAPSGSGEALTKLGLAADPGVLEVNLPPCETWEAYERVLSQCGEAAAAVGLQLTKRQLNGAIYGTGGGSHLAFGGPDLQRNPFLADPGRIASILRYWQHHPALSYLFSGQYVGAGSQAPRVDEGPSHGLYELEVACEGIEGLAAAPDGEWIDQCLKNLLTDSSGNTHRAELCFDKFHNYAMPNGCLGIVEFRAFETFQDATTMSRIALFIRAVLTRLFKVPFREPLVRFGPELHDRYFLPAFLWEDFCGICADLKSHGFDFDPEWLREAFEFRCPVLGEMTLPGGKLELRRAFESWPLMAEESRGSATVRVVDNSSDRIQLMLSDAALLEQGSLLVNGVEVPFKEVNGKMICGVRYKCASAYPALHPHVPIQSPLQFEWLSHTNNSVTHAMRYFYWNPHAAIYDGAPESDASAAERRRERWQAAPDLVGRKAVLQKPDLAPEYRYTLDLRRHG